MASTVQLQDLRQAVRDQGEFRAAAYPDALLTRLINRSIKDLYGRLAKLDQSRYHSTATYSVAADAASADIGDQATDFWQAIGVEVDDSESESGYYSLARYQWEERNDYGDVSDKRSMRYEIRGNNIRLHPPAPTACTLRLHYIPVLTALSADTDAFDGVNGWDDVVVYDVCTRLALSEESDHTGFAKERERCLAAIFGQAVVDRDQPKQIVDVERGSRWPWWPTRWRR